MKARRILFLLQLAFLAYAVWYIKRLLGLRPGAVALRSAHVLLD